MQIDLCKQQFTPIDSSDSAFPLSLTMIILRLIEILIMLTLLACFLCVAH